jgi:superoxide dismutase, Fe-Mn family
MNYEPMPLVFDATRLRGLSERLIVSHHRNNYGGAVRRLNEIRARLQSSDVARLPGFELNGLKREELIATNSMLLHEVHFSSLGGNGDLEPGPMRTALAASFGSYERWQTEFVAMGRALAGGSGWVLLSWFARGGTLVNQWAADHAHALGEATPLVALDMYEHAYHIDYGAAAADYVSAFMQNLHWGRIAERFEDAVAASVAAIEIAPEALVPHLMKWQVIDVRRRPLFEEAQKKVSNAHWRDPEQVDQWAGDLDRTRPVAVYCLHGHAISRATALALKQRGFDAHCVAGGIEAWNARGLPVEAKGA